MRPTRRAARCAKPSFLLAGAVLRRVRTHRDNAEKRHISSKKRPNDGSRTNLAYELLPSLLPATTWRRFWSPRRTPERSWGLSARKLERSCPPGPTPIDPLRSTWAPRATPSYPLRSTWALRPAPRAGPSDLSWPYRPGPVVLARSIWPRRNRLTIYLSTGLHRTICNDMLASSGSCLRSTWVPRPIPKHPLCSTWAHIRPGFLRSGQVSSFPAALSLPSIRLAKKKRLTYRRACIARSAAISLHRTSHASSLVINNTEQF